MWREKKLSHLNIPQMTQLLWEKSCVNGEWDRNWGERGENIRYDVRLMYGIANRTTIPNPNAFLPARYTQLHLYIQFTLSNLFYQYLMSIRLYPNIPYPKSRREEKKRIGDLWRKVLQYCLSPSHQPFCSWLTIFEDWEKVRFSNHTYSSWLCGWA